jgi:hypothetical protein
MYPPPSSLAKACKEANRRKARGLEKTLCVGVANVLPMQAYPHADGWMADTHVSNTLATH